MPIVEEPPRFRAAVPPKLRRRTSDSIPCFRLDISPGFCLLCLWFGASCGWGTLWGVLTAAAVHEIGHLLALRLCGRRAAALHIRLTGANLLSAAALSLAGQPAARVGVHLALCLFNLLPVRPLDGGEALYTLLCWLVGPSAGEWAAAVCGGAGLVLAAVCTAGVVAGTGGNLWVIPAAGGLVCAAVRKLRE